MEKLKARLFIVCLVAAYVILNVFTTIFDKFTPTPYITPSECINMQGTVRYAD